MSRSYMGSRSRLFVLAPAPRHCLKKKYLDFSLKYHITMYIYDGFILGYH